MEHLKTGKRKTQSYSEVIRSFSITLHFYSPRAYQYIREKFKNHLPSVTTLRKWYSNCASDEKHGISDKSLRAVATVAESFKNEGKALIVSISFDEMSIRRLVQWNDSKKRFMGYISHGQFVGDIPVAKNALVFLVTGVNADFSLPVAHYFIIQLKAQEKALLIYEVITAVTRLGVRVSNITFDGLQSNTSACEQLRASFKKLEIRSYILNPVNERRAYILLDACHMLKLARNCIASEKFMHHQLSNNVISWVFF